MICLKLVNTDKVNCTVLRYYAILRLWDAGKRRPFCTANRRFVWPGTSLCTRSHTCWLLAWSCLIYVHVFTYIVSHFGDMATTWWTHESSICAILCRHAFRSKFRFGLWWCSVFVSNWLCQMIMPANLTALQCQITFSILQPTNIAYQLALVASRVDKVTSSGIPS